ncbi:MAG: GH25 family lysozyme [Candidatus Onthomonas sp.]
MRRKLSLLLALLLGLQLLLPVQAMETELLSDAEPLTDEFSDTAIEGEAVSEEPDAEEPDVMEPLPEEETSVEELEVDGSLPPEEEQDSDPAASVEEDEQAEEKSAGDASDRLYNGQEADYEDPQFLKLLEDGFFDYADEGVSVAAETSVTHNSRFKGYDVLQGIDISKWNSITSWSKLAKEVDFAIIRCGNRTTSGGTLSKDPKFHEYMKAAQEAGLEIGVYIYSQAITEQEAREEAELALEMCEGYSFRLPIVIDYEYYTSGRLLDAKLTKTQRTNICRAFCEVIEAAGYPAMIYANKSMLLDDMNGEQLAKEGYEIWLAHWVSSSNYANTYTYWQYTDKGEINGISGYVDMNYYYKLPEAKLKGTYCCANGVHLVWDEVALADQYRIYRKKEGASAWTEIGSVSGPDTLDYLDETAKEGVSYRYAVQSCDGNVRALYDRAGTAVTYQPQFSLTGAKNETGGIRLTWNAMEEYDSYRIFRRSGTSGSWSVLAEITDLTQTSYLDTQVVSDSGDGVYTYTICGVTDGQQGSYDPYGFRVVWLSAPTLVSAATCAAGMQIKWKTVNHAQGYYVYRAEDGKWKKIATIKDSGTASYIDEAAHTYGTTYRYTVVAYAGSERSSYDHTGVSGLCMETPELVSAEAVKKGIQVTWKPAALAEKYRVYRKSEKNSWSLITTVTDSTDFLDTTAEYGVSYTYTVRSVASGGVSWYDMKGVSALRLATPEPKAPSRTSVSGVKITWTAVAGAVKYRVYRRTTGSWQSLGYTTNTSFVDTKSMTANTTYYYTVRAYDGDSSVSGYQSPGVAFHNLSTPELLGTSARSDGIEVRWNMVDGATKYVIYRKTSDTSWSRITTVKDASSYVDTSAASGMTYLYTVRASCENGLSWYDSQGVSGTFLSVPKLKKAVQGTKGATVTWEAVSGAKGYYVYRRTGTGSWTRLAAVSGTSYLDTAQLSFGTAYSYTVRAYSGKLLSSYEKPGVRYLPLDTPSVKTIANSSTGIQLQWNSVAGAKQYIVYRKTDGTSWSKLAVVSDLSYIDQSAVSGTAYTYTLRAYADGQKSCYNTAGYTCLRLETPELTQAQQISSGVRISWNPVSGADGYRVYRRTTGSGWKLLGTVSGTRYVDTDPLEEASVYCYTVRAYSGKTLSAFDTSGLFIQILATPNLTGAENQADGILVSWSPVAGTTEYRVYRKTEGSSWSVMGVCTDTCYLDQTAEDGVTYIYTVRALSEQGTSLYDANGISCLRTSIADTEDDSNDAPSNDG